MQSHASRTPPEVALNSILKFSKWYKALSFDALCQRMWPMSFVGSKCQVPALQMIVSIWYSCSCFIAVLTRFKIKCSLLFADPLPLLSQYLLYLILLLYIVSIIYFFLSWWWWGGGEKPVTQQQCQQLFPCALYGNFCPEIHVTESTCHGPASVLE